MHCEIARGDPAASGLAKSRGGTTDHGNTGNQWKSPHASRTPTTEPRRISRTHRNLGHVPLGGIGITTESLGSRTGITDMHHSHARSAAGTAANAGPARHRSPRATAMHNPHALKISSQPLNSPVQRRIPAAYLLNGTSTSEDGRKTMHVHEMLREFRCQIMHVHEWRRCFRIRFYRSSRGCVPLLRLLHEPLRNCWVSTRREIFRVS